MGGKIQCSQMDRNIESNDGRQLSREGPGCTSTAVGDIAYRALSAKTAYIIGPGIGG